MVWRLSGRALGRGRRAGLPGPRLSRKRGLARPGGPAMKALGPPIRRSRVARLFFVLSQGFARSGARRAIMAG
ncbi:hypothetical protein [Methylobacterium frigidaeris]|uniref:hypothetical protein n=1 Tax=Methylobacterium frigidaeris TaxID=2038277 RepID=UPI0010561E6B|nr:hypothetical protein [Methylobacterium frigidaeris]